MSAPFLTPMRALSLGAAIWAVVLLNQPPAPHRHDPGSGHALAPLKVKGVPSEVGVEVYPQKGAREPRPVVVVIASDPGTCQSVRDAYASSGHVLCGEGSLVQAEKKLKAGTAYLKKTYPRHTAGAPAHLYVDPAHADVGWRLLLKEPGFFSYAFVPGLKEQALNNITLRALHGIGGGSRGPGVETLVLTMNESKRLKFLINIASRRGLKMHAIGNHPESLERAIRLIRLADQRFTSFPAPSE